MVREDPVDLMGLDGTSTYCWFAAAMASREEASQPRVLVSRSGQALTGILPLLRASRNKLGSELCTVTDIIGGRNGLLMSSLDKGTLSVLLSHVKDAFPDWVALRFNMVAGSPHAEMFAATCRALGYPLHQQITPPSPFFPLLKSDEEFRPGVSKNVTQTMRKARNKAAKTGTLRFREFTTEGEAEELLQAVMLIERQSWKQGAGTAITSRPEQEAFYRALFPRAMREGLLLGLVLYLDEVPIAHHFGLIRGQVFSCLKHSNVESEAKLSPSHLVMDDLFPRLRAYGVKHLDCMGASEPHKLRWSNQNRFYERVSFTVYNKNLKGRVLSAARRLKATLQTKPSASPKDNLEPNADHD